MPIPDFTAAGLLPPGIHPATRPEVAGRFGCQNDRRVELWGKLEAFLDFAQTFNLFDATYLDGSFVTDKAAPGDVDVVLVIQKANAVRLVTHANARQIMDTFAVKKTYEVHLFIQQPPCSMADFFQSLRADEAIRRNVAPDQRRGILEVAL
ncbi:MAG TPA: hypothetical protein VGM88_05130 [Kofleriaceae bacterium]